MRYFTWDPLKAASNLRKHGVSFEDATGVFADPQHVLAIDNYDRGEERLRIIGLARGYYLLTVIHTSIDEVGDEYIRIISARQASPREEKIYSEGMGSLFN
jgi:uncharacterized protein